MEYPASYCDTADCGCSQLMDVLAARGVKTIVLSPGSRNTHPLMIACAARPELKKHLVTDERTAAFMALGIAMVSRNPVAIACTSGTALYNYAPAVAEAFYQQIPLIVISADRPGQWIDQDDSQTLRQFRSLENIVKKSFDIPVWDPAPIPCANGRFRSEGMGGKPSCQRGHYSGHDRTSGTGAYQHPVRQSARSDSIARLHAAENRRDHNGHIRHSIKDFGRARRRTP